MVKSKVKSILIVFKMNITFLQFRGLFINKDTLIIHRNIISGTFTLHDHSQQPTGVPI